MKTDPRWGVAMVLTAAALWGTTGTAQTFAGETLSAGWFGALRLVVASLFFAAYALLTGHGRSAGRHAMAGPLPLAGVLGAGVCMAVYNLAFFAGIRHTGVAVGTAVALGSGPLWAGILQSLWTRTAPASTWWIGTGVAVGGGVLMTLAGGRPMSQISAFGIALCLLSGLSYAAYTLINKELMRHASAASVTLRAFSVAALLAVPAAWLDNGGAPVMAAADGWSVIYVGVVTAGVAYLLFSQALRHISAATGVTLALAEPVMAFALAVLVVGERPSVVALVGLLLVVAGVCVVVRAELRQQSSAALPVRATAAAP